MEALYIDADSELLTAGELVCGRRMGSTSGSLSRDAGVSAKVLGFRGWTDRYISPWAADSESVLDVSSARLEDPWESISATIGNVFGEREVRLRDCQAIRLLEWSTELESVVGNAVPAQTGYKTLAARLLPDARPADRDLRIAVVGALASRSAVFKG